ncbi:retrovirus-related Pol polyprotein from transposon 412 [Trichonephila clavipes]|nr:retrovirus-related Pol polyprotein from transposon 412 [Trichonephila clavipes]
MTPPTAGHLGFAKTYDRIRKRFYWPGMYRNVVRYVMHCRECQRRKSVPQRPPGRLVPIPPAIAPFHRIGIDLLGRFQTEVDEIAKFLLEEIILGHGAPRVIITDRGAVFRSRLVSSLVDLCNIDHRFTTAYHPQTNGLTERFNKTLADMLSMYVDVEQKNWDEILPFVTFAYITAKQETTGFTPFYLLHGREVKTTLDTMPPFCPNDFDDNNITKIADRAEESRQLARVHTLRAQDKDRRRYDSKHQMVSYAPGDLVWIYTPVRKVGSLRKTLKKTYRPPPRSERYGIAWCWQQWITEGRVYRCGGSGRPRNTNDREDRAIRRVATSAPTTSLASIQRHLPPSRHPVPSRETIRRRLTEVGLRSRRPLRRLPLTPHHRQCRLDFCRPRATWSVTDWRRVIFSDESRFSLSADDHRIRVWRRTGQLSDPAFIVERHTAISQGVTVWGAISWDTRSSLIGPVKAL